MENWYRNEAANSKAKQIKNLSEKLKEQGLEWRRPKKDNFYSMAMDGGVWGDTELAELPEEASQYEMHNIHRLGLEQGVAYGNSPMLIPKAIDVEEREPRSASSAYIECVVEKLAVNE